MQHCTVVLIVLDSYSATEIAHQRIGEAVTDINSSAGGIYTVLEYLTQDTQLFLHIIKAVEL